MTLSLTGAKAVTFTASTTLGDGNTTYDGQEVVVSGCTLTVDGVHSFASLVLADGAVLTHSPAPAGESNNRLDLAIAGGLTIDATSRVDVNAKGYGPAAGPGAGSNDYSTPAGGGHGGPGGNGYYVAGSVSYGDLLIPAQCGSGGGNGPAHNPSAGGAGGGVIRLDVGGVLTVGGQLTANGESMLASGGAGGSIYVRAGTLAGNGGITANGGGAGYYLSGGGGGGRIALYYGNSTFSGGLTALGGLSAGAKCGGAGTFYAKASSQSVGDLRLDNSGVTNAMETLITTPVAYRLTLANVTAYATNALALTGLRVSAGGLLTHPFQGPRLQVQVQGNAVVESGGAVGADARGYPLLTGPGAGAGNGGMWGAPGSGAGHGGQGGAAWYTPGGMTYGSATEPVDFGSGGGGNNERGIPNRGGGAIQLTVAGTLTLDGRVSANADAATGSYDGGGAGGSIWLTVSRLNGAGSITADGQVAGYPGSGSGGGGRIAIYAGANEFAGAAEAIGGQGGNRSGVSGSLHYGPNVPAGLIAWWRGEGDASDTMGAHPGTAQGGVSYPPAQVGDGFFFDSNDDRVDVPHAEAFNLGAGGFTAQFWMRGTKAQPDYFSALLDKSHGWTDSTGWALHCWTNDGHVSLAIGQGGGGNANFNEVRSNTDLLDGGFHQVAAVWTGTEAQLFVDGALEDRQACLPPVNNARPLLLGYFWGGGVPQRFFRGALDEVMIFNRALSPEEIASLYYSQGGPLWLGIQPASDGVLLSWPASATRVALVSRTNLTAGVWEAVTNAPSLNGDRQEIHLPADAPAQRFFRLAQ